MKLLELEVILLCEPIYLYLVNFVGKGILYPNCWGKKTHLQFYLLTKLKYFQFTR